MYTARFATQCTATQCTATQCTATLTASNSVEMQSGSSCQQSITAVRDPPSDLAGVASSISLSLSAAFTGVAAAAAAGLPWLAATRSGRLRRYSLGVASLGLPCLSSLPSAMSFFLIMAYGPRPHLGGGEAGGVE